MKQIKRKLIIFAMLFCAFTAINAQVSVSGTVKDAKTGEELVGVTVLEKGTQNGAITDLDGNFEFQAASAASVLVVTYVGYVAQEIAVGSKTTFDIKLQEEAVALKEVVAIGYGSQTKKELTGSVTSVKAEDFNKGVSSNAMGLVQGKVAGLTIIKNGGDDPAQNSYNVQLRGVGSLSGTAAPLYVIDGVPGGNLASVNPNDIESIDVLKDGSAAAIYGTRANAGVILITTKRGTGNLNCGVTTEYTGTVSTGFIADKPKIMNAAQYREKMVANGFGIDYGADTDWLKEITRTPVSHTHNVSISGGGDKFNYRGSVGYRGLQGLAKKSDYEEINGRFAANQKALNKKLDLAYDFAFTSDKKSWANYDNFNQAIRSNPTMPIRSDEERFKQYGGYYESDNFYTRNPLSDVEQTTNDQKDQVVLGSVRGTLQLLEGLKFSTFYSVQNNSTWVGKYQASTLREVAGKEGVANQSQAYETQQVVENTLQYLKTFGKSHNLQALLGQGYQTNIFHGFNAFNSKFPLDNLLYDNLGMGEGKLSGDKLQSDMGSYKYKDKLASFFARVMYNYNQKYFINASARMEGSSKFGKKADPVLGQWGVFPAISGSWDIKSEDFMEDAPIDILKLRVGYGVTGNMPVDPNDIKKAHYLYAMLVGPGSNYVYSDGNFILPWGPTSNMNPYIHWEEKHEFNAGIDFGFLNNRLFGSIDGYFRNTTDLLYEYDVPSPPNPYGKKWDNYGQIHNYGLEFQVTGVLMKKKDIDWTAGLNAAWNTNKVVRITGEQYGTDGVEAFVNTGFISSGDGETGNYVMRLAEGQPIGNFYGFKYYGINEKGEWVFETPSGGYTTKPTDADKMILDNAQPAVTFGLNTAFRYKNFDVALNFRGQIGGLIFNETRYFYENTRGVENALQSAFEGDAELLTAWKTSGSTNASIRRFSDFYLENASYFKLNDVTVGYSPNISESLSKYVSKVRVSLTAQNLFTITGYSGHDPSSVNMSGIMPGFDGRSYYPTQRTLTLGLSLIF
ncbi:MAG: SusC/RagA family TonB-linked outer membrane protein [Prevotellaceae bacterium]|jgi:TonB-linked SusC/RagA family outer membrane protein|nr:SusC/RagA family TonB-linked outer membrane protein [Prevotellaceae bacterium]